MTNCDDSVKRVGNGENVDDIRKQLIDIQNQLSGIQTQLSHIQKDLDKALNENIGRKGSSHQHTADDVEHYTKHQKLEERSCDTIWMESWIYPIADHELEQLQRGLAQYCVPPVLIPMNLLKPALEYQRAIKMFFYEEKQLAKYLRDNNIQIKQEEEKNQEEQHGPEPTKEPVTEPVTEPVNKPAKGSVAELGKGQAVGRDLRWKRNHGPYQVCRVCTAQEPGIHYPEWTAYQMSGRDPGKKETDGRLV